MPSHVDSRAVQQEIARMLEKEFVPWMDHYFSSLSEAGKIDRIDRLELNLGTIRLEDLQTDFVRKLMEKLLEELPAVPDSEALFQSVEAAYNLQQIQRNGQSTDGTDAASIDTSRGFSDKEKVMFKDEATATENAQTDGEFSSGVTIVFGEPEETVLVPPAHFEPQTIVFSDDVQTYGSPETAAIDAVTETDISAKWWLKPPASDEPTEAELSRQLAANAAKETNSTQQVDNRFPENEESGRELDLLVFFLQTGCYPWWMGSKSPDQLAIAVKRLVQRKPETVRNTLRYWIRFGDVQRRLVTALPDDLLLECMYLVAGESEKERLHRYWSKALQIVVEIDAGKTKSDKWKTAMWQRLTALQSEVEFYPIELLQQLASEIAQKHRNQSEAQALEKLQSFGSAEIQVLCDLFGVPEKWADVLRLQAGGLSEFDTNARNMLPNTKNMVGEDLVFGHALPPSPQIDAFSESEKIYVDNAGLILLWPFLIHFFTHCGLMEEQEFRDVESRDRALWLTQYLVFGASYEVFEAQLPLNKVLVGMEPYATVTRPEPVTDQELEKIIGLLEAVIGYVPAWRNLTPDGLRSAYLQREGALSMRDGQWVLQVKRMTYDILLEKVPWSLTIVRLPWMEKLLFAEW